MWKDHSQPVGPVWQSRMVCLSSKVEAGLNSRGFEKKTALM